MWVQDVLICRTAVQEYVISSIINILVLLYPRTYPSQKQKKDSKNDFREKKKKKNFLFFQEKVQIDESCPGWNIWICVIIKQCYCNYL